MQHQANRSEIWTEFSELQPENAASPMDVTLLGIVIEVRLLQL